MRCFGIFFMLFITFELDAFGQVGCRRNSNGILYELTNFDGTYNYDFPYGDVTDLCLPLGSTGMPCTIRIPFTTITYAGTYGSYSALNCPLDGYSISYFISTLVGMFFLKKTRAFR